MATWLSVCLSHYAIYIYYIYFSSMAMLRFVTVVLINEYDDDDGAQTTGSIIMRSSPDCSPVILVSGTKYEPDCLRGSPHGRH